MTQEFTVLHLFSGIGGAALGFQVAKEEYRGLLGSFRTLAGIDVDPESCKDFRNLTGAPASQMDLFTRGDYISFHGCEPPETWREATPQDLMDATGREFPDVVFLSPPCKGFSGLLPAKSAKSEKYQALNRLVIRGLELTVEAFAEDLPAVIMLENVPRITTRGEWLLRKVKQLLGKHGYVFHEGYHDCGEIGGLGQHRKRYLLIARHKDKVPMFVYQPPVKRVRSIGEILGPLPSPGEPTMGPMHRLPRLQWKTWVRLALIPAGGDWRDLEKIAPEQYRLEYVPRGSGPYGVQDWEQPGSTVIGNAFIKGSNPAAVADPRLNHEPREGVYKVQRWDEPSTTVTGAARVNTSNGAACVADPRLSERENRHPAVYHVVRWDEPGPCVTGTRFGSGAPAIADPRLPEKNVRFHNKYQLQDWEQPATTVTGIADIQAGAQSVADPRVGLGKNTHNCLYRVEKWEDPAYVITGATRPAGGAQSVADPRLGCSLRAGMYGVQAWDQPGNTVTGARNLHSGTAAVADPRIPKDTEQGTWVIIAEDGTWHRPLTTLELAALQGFPLNMPDGSPLTLAGNSDARWRERIGNAVPPPAAEAIAAVILRSLMLSKANAWELSETEIWVRRWDNEQPNPMDRGKVQTT
ncbi:MAG: DNA cytosine methyltransferase [Deltaproteobacteria bacterium 37-65-8]|nr:MAG: DNA cytosine methyltransferase [Deltaproteobacteria bacterium 37-65-8]